MHHFQINTHTHYQQLHHGERTTINAFQAKDKTARMSMVQTKIVRLDVPTNS